MIVDGKVFEPIITRKKYTFKEWKKMQCSLLYANAYSLAYSLGCLEELLILGIAKSLPDYLPFVEDYISKHRRNSTDSYGNTISQDVYRRIVDVISTDIEALNERGLVIWEGREEEAVK